MELSNGSSYSFLIINNLIVVQDDTRIRHIITAYNDLLNG